VSKIWMLVRGPNLEASMSRYLIDRIRALPNVEVLCETEIVGVNGEDATLNSVRWRTAASGAEQERPVRHIFLFIGADPNTAWLEGSGIPLDDKGFVRTDGPLPLETARRGVFAIGDVRSGSVKRVASAVGEGAQVVATLHAYLAERTAAPALAVARSA
jgi:thioredoxin reductase (NADPH)